MPTAPNKKEFRFTGWHMLAIMVAFFGTIIAVNLTLGISASRTWTGLVVKDSYVASQQFNDNLKAAKIQNDKGWRSHLAYENGSFTLRLKDKTGAMLTLTDAKLSIGRPAFEQQDSQMDLTIIADGIHVAKVEMGQGNWFVKVIGKVDGEPYRREARFLVDKNRTGVLK